MWQTNSKIGFDDRLVMLFGLPVLSFIVPIVFFGCRINRYPFFSWDKFFTTLLIMFLLWIGNRCILIWSRTKYPSFSETRRRLIFQSVLMFVFTLAGNNLLGFLADDVFLKDSAAGHFVVDVLINSNAAALFCTIMVIAIYESIYFMNQLRQSVEEKEMLKRENLYAQLNALKTQVNPHFLFNNLNTLCSIIPDDPAQAVSFVQQMSKVYRHILEVKDEQSISLKEELDVLNAYGFLLKTRFGDNLSINIRVPDEKLQKKIAPLSLQLLLENAIKHNIVSAKKPLTIDVYALNGNIVVSNNLQVKNQVIDSTGNGLDNIRNRYKLLSGQLVEVTTGLTHFTVAIPLI